MIHVAALIVHFVAMILGLGQVAVLAGTSISDLKLLRQLVSFVSWSVLAVFATGAVLVALSPDHPEKHLWMKGVMLLTIFLGFLAGTSRVLLRKASDPVEPEQLAKLRARAWAIAAVTVIIIVLISAKPG